MKVLHINSNYLYTTLHEKLIESLNKNNIINKVYMPNHGGIDFVVPPKDYVYYPVCFKKYDRYLYNYKQKKIFDCLKNNFDIHQYSLIHAHTLFTDGHIAYKLYKKYSLPYVVAIRNTDVNEFFKKRILLRKKGLEILDSASKIIFISKAYRDIVFEKYVPIDYRKKLFEKCMIIPNGIDSFWLNNKYMSRDNISKKTLKIIFAGRIDKNKNIGTTIKACKLLIDKGLDITFTIVGRVEDSNEFEYINRHNFVKYLPQQTKERLIDLYRSSDIFVMPSKTETFGLVYVEAMSQGLPVIYTRGQGFDGQFKDGQIGYNVDCLNEKEIAHRILDITKNYSKISFNCIKSCDNFSWDILVKDYVNIYKSCIK